MVDERHEPHERLLHADEVFRIQGAVFEVNRVMGAGFLEAVYQECLAIELGSRGLPFRSRSRG
jgi:GxxExxY protein